MITRTEAGFVSRFLSSVMFFFSSSKRVDNLWVPQNLVFIGLEGTVSRG